jgi:hypothetical protein
VVSVLRTRSSHFALLAVLAIGVGGCSIPTPVSIASYAIDGVSYIVTGKSMSDHALSAVMDQDCALLRIVQGKLVCHDYGDNSEEELYQALAAEYGRFSPLVSPYEIVPVDSVASVGESDGITIPYDKRDNLAQLSREQRLARARSRMTTVVAKR